jgi:hypothetical protein
VQGAPKALSRTHNSVDRPAAWSGGGEEEEHEAKEDRGVAAVDSREEAVGEMRHEIGDGHIAGEDERHGSREKANRDERPADEFKQAVEKSNNAGIWSTPGIAGKCSSLPLPCSKNSSPVMIRKAAVRAGVHDSGIIVKFISGRLLSRSVIRRLRRRAA